MNNRLSPERRQRAESFGYTTIQNLEHILSDLNRLKGEERDHLARYCAVVITDIEKIIAYVAIHIVEMIPKQESMVPEESQEK